MPVLFTLPASVTKYLDKSNLSENGFVWTHGSGPHSIMVGKSWQQGFEAACGMVPPIVVWVFLLTISLIKISFSRHAQMLFSQVVLDLRNFTIQINHQNTQSKKMEVV